MNGQLLQPMSTPAQLAVLILLRLQSLAIVAPISTLHCDYLGATFASVNHRLNGKRYLNYVRST